MNSDDYKFYKSHGICVACRKEKVKQGKTMCLNCLDENKYLSEKYRTESSKNQRKAYIKRKREICIAFGVCRECLARDAEHGLKCSKCYWKERNKQVSKRELYKATNSCTLCGGERVKGFKVCRRCLDKCRANVANRKTIDNSTHYWRVLQGSEVKYIRDYKKNVLNL